MRKSFLCLILVLAAASAVSAQDFKTGYFLDNFTYGYRVNPGASIEGKPYTFIGLGIGNVSAELHSNLSAAAFLNKAMDQFIIDDEVSIDEALSGFSDKNSILMNANVNLLTFGRQTEYNRFSIEFNLRSDSYFNMPFGFISSTKRALHGLATDDWDDSYNFAGLQVSTNAYTEIAFGYSQKIGDHFTVGGRLKGLVGFATAGADLSADVFIKNQDTEIESIQGKLDGKVAISAPMDLAFNTMQSGGKTYYDLYGTDYEQLFHNAIGNPSKHVAGWGAAVDLGATYEPIDGLYISASLLDLGFISWKNTIYGKFSFSEELHTGSPDNENLGDDIFALEKIAGARFSTPLNYTVHLGAKYRMPFYDALTVGLITTFQPHYRDFRLGVDVTPLKFLSFAGSAAITNYGANLGLALNIKFPIINFFIGSDTMVAPSGATQALLGTKLNTMVTTGLVLAI
ncbi:MAG: hypothetical protein J5835_07905 [Bacteroidales bacterium]|nr:hypothetical protein [Bacteroidales bacterium]